MIVKHFFELTKRTLVNVEDVSNKSKELRPLHTPTGILVIMLEGVGNQALVF